LCVCVGGGEGVKLIKSLGVGLHASGRKESTYAILCN
jgi:hypothetical protein